MEKRLDLLLDAKFENVVSFNILKAFEYERQTYPPPKKCRASLRETKMHFFTLKLFSNLNT